MFCGNARLADTKLNLGAAGHCQSSEADVLHPERLSGVTRPSSKIRSPIAVGNVSLDLLIRVRHRNHYEASVDHFTTIDCSISAYLQNVCLLLESFRSPTGLRNPCSPTYNPTLNVLR